MSYTHRPLNLPADMPQALALADLSGLNTPHIADWPYRFSSWAMDDLQNTQVWMDSDSTMLGWVAMQTPFWAIDCVMRPDASPELYRDMLKWAQSRASGMVSQGAGRPMWFLAIDAERHEQRRVLEEQGFEDISEASEDPWSDVLLELTNAALPPALPMPQGLHIRSLNPNTEIQKYVDLHRAVFESENMTTGWRLNTTRAAGYINALDLVIASDDDELFGFCVAWLRQLASGERVGQVEPLGVAKSHRGQKLSRQLMTEAIRRMRELGATRIVVQTEKQRTTAIAAYQSMGFRVSHQVPIYKHVTR